MVIKESDLSNRKNKSMDTGRKTEYLEEIYQPSKNLNNKYDVCDMCGETSLLKEGICNSCRNYYKVS